ncbi:WG repeat-containing protein [Galbibacter sp. BG1]|uniref:WG repeat-containing protein n=1 Tax=Galbibacter sp. BG1 TaxID=1170699 RepID=UPI0015BCE08E|nr:WG repeat-containing protein [Galbibacter sp. BG1]QLE01665.1 WG repeat-containing protein [Galbibacter sp. BG1]
MKNLLSLIIILILNSNCIQSQVIEESATTVEEAPRSIDQDYYITQLNGKYILTNKNGDPFISNIDEISYASGFSSNYVVKKENKVGLVSARFEKILIPIEYDTIENVYGQYWVVTLENKLGLYTDDITLEPEFDEIKFSTQKGAEIHVKKNGKYGILNKKGELVVPIVYNEIILKNNLFELKKDDKISYLIDGKISKYNINGNNVFRTSKYDNYYVFSENKKKGILDDSNNIVIEPKYDEIKYKRIYYHSNLPEDILIVKNKGKWGIIDIQENNIIPVKYESLNMQFPEKIILGKNGFKQIYDTRSKKLNEEYNFDKFSQYSKDFSIIRKDNKETLIDNDNLNMLFPYQYDYIVHDYLPSNKLIIVEMNEKKGIINIHNEILIPIIYDEVELFCENNIVVKKNDEYSILNSNNKILIPFSKNEIFVYTKNDNTKGLGIYSENSPKRDEYDCDLNKIE